MKQQYTKETSETIDFAKKHKILVIIFLLVTICISCVGIYRGPHIDNLNPEDYNDNPNLKKLVLALQKRERVIIYDITAAKSDPRTYDVLTLALDSRGDQRPDYGRGNPTTEYGVYGLGNYRMTIIYGIPWDYDKKLEFCMKGLSDPYPGVRDASALCLQFYGDREGVVEALIRTLSDPSEFVVKTAIHSLGETGDKRAIEALTKALKDKRNESMKPDILKALKNLKTLID